VDTDLTLKIKVDPNPGKTLPFFYKFTFNQFYVDLIVTDTLYDKMSFANVFPVLRSFINLILLRWLRLLTYSTLYQANFLKQTKVNVRVRAIFYPDFF
jgi:hypothetical protein